MLNRRLGNKARNPGSMVGRPEVCEGGREDFQAADFRAEAIEADRQAVADEVAFRAGAIEADSLRVAIEAGEVDRLAEETAVGSTRRPCSVVWMPTGTARLTPTKCRGQLGLCWIGLDAITRKSQRP